MSQAEARPDGHLLHDPARPQVESQEWKRDMGDIPDYENGEPEPIVNDGESIHDLVILDMRHMDWTQYPINLDTRTGIRLVIGLMRNRKQYGLAKYKTVLQAHNGRDPMVDIVEELGDAIAYYRQWIEESKPEARKYLVIEYRKLIAAAMSILVTIHRISVLKRSEKEDPIDA